MQGSDSRGSLEDSTRLWVYYITAAPPSTMLLAC